MNITGKTKVVGLLGWPVGHSFSPKMHNAAFVKAGLNWVYVPLGVPPVQVKQAVEGLSALSLSGVNVTVPHKQAVMPFLHEIEEGARRIGAVNTIVVTGNGRLIGHNTDWSGCLRDWRALGVDVLGRDCVVLGAGGSARAVVYALAQAGGQISVFARRLEQAQSLVNTLQLPMVQAKDLADLSVCVPNLLRPLIVNTTPVGMEPNTNNSVWPDDLEMPNGSFIYDLVYNPAQTFLMKQAQTAGCESANGLGMLVHQGAEAFKLWTGFEPDVTIMRQAILG